VQAGVQSLTVREYLILHKLLILMRSSIRASCEADGISPDDIAVILAEMKAQVVAQTRPDALIIGSDQILCCEGAIFGKPETRQQAKHIMAQLQGRTHQLITSLVIFKSGMRVWHHIATFQFSHARVL
jgi:septum formation protein